MTLLLPIKGKILQKYPEYPETAGNAIPVMGEPLTFDLR